MAAYAGEAVAAQRGPYTPFRAHVELLYTSCLHSPLGPISPPRLVLDGELLQDCILYTLYSLYLVLDRELLEHSLYHKVGAGKVAAPCLALVCETHHLL